MKIVFIGSVKMSELILKKLIQNKINIIAVITKSNSSFNSDFCDLSELANAHKINCYYSDRNILSELLFKLKPDLVFCCGWSNILDKNCLKYAPVIGFHPTKLPHNRGRHPVIWSIALGLKSTASTFFLMDEGIDSGKILSQKKIKIDSNEEANTLYNKINKVASEQALYLAKNFKKINLKKIKNQNNSLSNYWRKRNKDDGRIDFRMNSEAIDNLVRSLTRPYIGAHLLHNNNEIKIWKVERIKFFKKNIEPGKVIESDNNYITVKTFNGAIKIIDHEFINIPKIGEYL